MELQFPLILDGATGTQLQKRGYTNEQCAEQWVLEHPEAIQDIQKNYVAAGSNIVYASTFGANRIKLEGNGIRNQTAAYNTRLVGLSREAVGENAMVAGDIAPTGKFLYPIGDLSFEDLLDVYTEQAQALEQAGVDLFVIETTMTIPEARAALLAVKSVSEKPVFVTFTCDENGKTLTGTDVVAALVIMQSMGADAVGLNCSVGPDQMLLQLERMAQYAQVPLIAKPNAGIPEMVDGKAVYTCTPEEFAALVPEMAAAGVGVYGGCCGSEPAHIAALAQAVKQAEIKKPASKHMDELVAATEREVMFCRQMLTAETCSRVMKMLWMPSKKQRTARMLFCPFASKKQTNWRTSQRDSMRLSSRCACTARMRHCWNKHCACIRVAHCMRAACPRTNYSRCVKNTVCSFDNTACKQTQI